MWSRGRDAAARGELAQVTNEFGQWKTLWPLSGCPCSSSVGALGSRRLPMLSELQPLRTSRVPQQEAGGRAVLCAVLPCVCVSSWDFNFWADSLKMQYLTLNGKVTKHRVVSCKCSVLVPIYLHLFFALSFFPLVLK